MYNQIITVEELMELLVIGRSHAYKLLKTGQIRGFKIGRNWRIPLNSVEEYIVKESRR